MYIDVETCQIPAIERFLTFLINYPPKQGLKSVRVFYRGEFTESARNLKNTLDNTFQHVEQICSHYLFVLKYVDKAKASL